jgi:hypothetical protein
MKSDGGFAFSNSSSKIQRANQCRLMKATMACHHAGISCLLCNSRRTVWQRHKQGQVDVFESGE